MRRKPQALSVGDALIGASDCDSLTARCQLLDGIENMKVRLAEIDASEKVQPFGNRSRQHLAGLCFKNAAVVKAQATDRCGCTVALVECDSTDMSAGQVRAGMAWFGHR